MTQPCRRDRHGYCWTCQADAQDRCPARVSRRGFISMLGSGLLVAAAPEIVTMPNRSGKDLHLATTEEWFFKAYERHEFGWIDVRAFEMKNGVMVFKATPIPVSAIYGTEGEDRGSSGQT